MAGFKASMEAGSIIKSHDSRVTPLKFNMTSEKWWLEDYLPFGMLKFSGAMLVLGRVCLRFCFNTARHSSSTARIFFVAFKAVPQLISFSLTPGQIAV